MLQLLLRRVVPMLPLPLRRAASPDRIRLLAQFMMFGTVGLGGLAVDTVTVYALRARLGLYGAGLVAYAAAATGNWVLNRLWTFRGQGAGPAHRQWVRFLLANSMGFVLNRGTYALLVTFLPLAAAQPVIATSAGAMAGMLVNFSLSRRMVFR
jgi:putative flippase GtrA